MFRRAARNLRIRVANSAEMIRDGLTWRPEVLRWWQEMGEIARVASPRRFDAFVLGAIDYGPLGKRPPWLALIVSWRVFRLSKVLGRLEQCAYIESGWTPGPDGHCVVTESGSRVGRDVQRTLGLVPYTDEPRRR